MPFLTNDPLPQCLQPSPLTPLLLARGHQRGSRRYLSDVKCLAVADEVPMQDVVRDFVRDRKAAAGLMLTGVHVDDVPGRGDPLLLGDHAGQIVRPTVRAVNVQPEIAGYGNDVDRRLL